MRPVGYPETSVTNYHFSLRNNPEERCSQFAIVFLPLHELFLLMHLKSTVERRFLKYFYMTHFSLLL